MDIREAKEDLKEMALKDFSNGAFMYQMLNSDNLDCAISKITKHKTKVNTNSTPITKKGYLTPNEQFLDVLSETIHFFETSFPALLYKEFFLGLLFYEKAPKFLLSKNYWGNNDFISYYKYNIKMFFVDRMYKTIKILYKESELKEFFRSNKITDRMSIKNSKHLDILYQFMKEVVWCNYNEYAVIVLFNDFNDYFEDIKGQNVSYKSDEDIYNSVWTHFESQWDILSRNYSKKIKNVKSIIVK